MRIFIPIIHFGRSGGFRVLSELANNWIRLGNKVIFICFTNNQFFSKPYFPTLGNILYVNSRGEEVLINEKELTFGYDNESSAFYRIKQLIGLTKGINKFTNKNDVILATYSITAFCVSLSKESKNKFYYIQAYEPEYFENNFLGWIKSFFISKTYELNLNRIVNSTVYYNYKNLKASKCVYPGLNFEIFNNNRLISNYKSGNQKIIIGCVGRREKVKGTHLVIEAYNILIKNNVNCVLKMAVFGNEDMLQDNIESITPKNDFELADFYKSIHVLVAPGLVQFGAVHYPVIEAMACQTPVITTPYYPANPDNSWIIEPNNSLDIVNKILNIISQPEESVIKAKKALADVNHLEWAIVSANMLDIFNQ